MRLILEVSDEADLELALRAYRETKPLYDEAPVDRFSCGTYFGKMNTPIEKGFWVAKTKTGWSVRRLYRKDEGSSVCS